MPQRGRKGQKMGISGNIYYNGKYKIHNRMNNNNEKLKPIEGNMNIIWLIGKKCRGRNHNSSN